MTTPAIEKLRQRLTKSDRLALQRRRLKRERLMTSPRYAGLRQELVLGLKTLHQALREVTL